MVRWLVDRYTRRKHAGAQLTEDQLVAEGDKSPGVLLASGYIAGGAIAGILFAFLAIPMKDGSKLSKDGRLRTIHSSTARTPICSR